MRCVMRHNPRPRPSLQAQAVLPMSGPCPSFRDATLRLPSPLPCPALQARHCPRSPLVCPDHAIRDSGSPPPHPRGFGPENPSGVPRAEMRSLSCSVWPEWAPARTFVLQCSLHIAQPILSCSRGHSAPACCALVFRDVSRRHACLRAQESGMPVAIPISPHFLCHLSFNRYPHPVLSK